ncbi:hypothetical protein [Bacillus benzoevorans]|uniref:DUF2157 domain-containing protein n=1 Tax=Bacillus benzoevorans TaxID=1456 RepID=A0A7X0HTQ5_9BACI|nr:hypothetical protein [Bacillus benzoevorans]MBB6446692.1 hypothetical protein [Bacillus benzoevorans]
MVERDSHSHERRKIFKEELKALKHEKYIDELDYNRMKYAYNLYVQNLDKNKASIEVPETSETTKVLQNPEQSELLVMDPLKELIQKLKDSQQQEAETTAMKKQAAFSQMDNGQGDETVPESFIPEAEQDNPISAPVQEKLRPAFTKQEKSADQTRERNITWGLILGVILLFIGGLVFGTSNWSSMNNLVKVIMVSLVSVVFFTISFVAGKYFKITKTAFAFLTLGSLFLPISLISIAYFELLGPTFSMYGEGKYLFGFVSSMICLSLYSYIAAKYRHRLFVWFSYLTATIAAAYLLALTYLPSDFFYLGMMLYNAMLLFAYYKLKNHEKWSVFTKELPVYTQLNLIVSTLLMLLFFENEIFYSVNILLTAVLYISMVFVNKTKHYHIVFTLLFVYGIYQLIENSVLQDFDYLGFALIGMLYLVFQKYTGKEDELTKIFRLTSGIISFCAFIFISYQGLLLRSDEDSFVLLAAYLMIAVNYLILANMAKKAIFRYLAPVFLMAACWQSYYVLLPGLDGGGLEIYLFAFAAGLFSGLYLLNNFKYFTIIKNSSFIVSIGTMALTIISTLINEELTQTTFLLFAFGVITFLTYRHTADDTLQKIAAWVNPLSWGFAVITLFDYLNKSFTFYQSQVEIIGHLALGGLLLLGVSYVWKKRNETALDVNTFLTGVALYTLSILSTPLEGYDHPYLISSIYFIGIAVYVLLVYKIKQQFLWIFVSLTSLFFFISLTAILDRQINLVQQWLVLYSLLIPLFLLAVYEFIGRKIDALKPYFFWTAHVYLVPAFLISVFYLSYASYHPVILLPALTVYIYSTLRQTKEWEIRLFLYAAFTALPVIFYLHFIYYRMEDVLTGDYLFLIVTGMITIVWAAAGLTWKRRIDWYLIPQAVMGLVTFQLFYDDDGLIHLGLFAVYTIFTLFLLHKRNWRIYQCIPLLMAVIYMVEFLPSLEKMMQIALVVLVFFAHHLFGKFTYKEIVKNEGKLAIDWYTILSAAYILILFMIIPGWEMLWLKLIPALLVVYYLFMLIIRFTEVTAKRIVKTLAAISLLLPYYTILFEFEWNQYIVTELFVLPYIALTIFLSRRTWQDYKQVMTLAQTIVLVIVTIILVLDALKSNTIYDAIIIGVLSLASIIGGMQYRIKSYFFVGIAVLLLNVLLQTRPFWGNFPWWGYLVIAGLTLIGFAGFNELQKQKKDTDSKSFFQKKKEQWIKKFKDWD